MSDRSQEMASRGPRFLRRVPRSYLLAVVVVVVAGGWVASGMVGGKNAPQKQIASQTVPPPRVMAQTLHAQERSSQLVLNGETEALRTVVIRAETKGTVSAVPVLKGQKVDAGALLVRLAADDRPARLAQGEALLNERTIAEKAARQLSKQGYRSTLKVAEAKADLEAARAQVAAARLDLLRTAIKAPFAGYVDALPVEVGDYLAVGAPVATVIDSAGIKVVGEVSERDAAHVVMGGPVEVTLPDGAHMAARVSYVSRIAEPSTRTFRVEAVVDATGQPSLGEAVGRLAGGMTAQLSLPLKSRRVQHLSPALLTLSDKGEVGIKAVDGNNRVVFYPVRMTTDTTKGMWVAGLPDTVTVITVGQEFVKVGETVQPVFASAAGAG
ncbi:efflux RND transporter periplasmic adaptor subunit [Varunaivibrio sulfuroxidans]|uniref:Multidrug efflux system membrane fusion protein n=1 Tax=Varunaivibrio sulfuroxidans TaxID=1773489 RepID=A0A4R3JE36_9PROT|nr:efflux RND transporter periplasmic adaptor subunit [Varunaivibrio sulfuroxidans]TCS62940.1 multidrug efflux system membrane fusion protein [Varunaivibrio sulfuroxidans]WES31984.1 efflux RND transporter periplasmic adaptor subunit [Varunaivibrio sulfuroxidans]